ncbi:hypothetical protein T06_16687 [Trichinella sp. T6]|nr:hypothetical protein T06_16687 [Trichinella sp. T6]
MDVENSEKTNPNYGRPGQFPFQRGHIDDEQHMNGSSRFGVHFSTASILSFFCQKASIAPGHRRSPLLDNIVASGKTSSSCVHLLPSVGLLFSLLCVCGGGKGEGSLASLVSEWASGIRLYSSLLAAVLHPYCGIFSPFLSNRGQRSRRSPPNLACHSTRRRYELRSTQIGANFVFPNGIHRSNDFADRSADPIRSDPIVRFISIVLLGPQVQMVQLGKWRSVESESARSAAGRVECVKAAPLLRAVHLL